MVVLETDKVSIDVRAPQDGIVCGKLAQEGETVEVGVPLMKMKAGEIGEGGGETRTAPPKIEPPTSTPPTKTESVSASPPPPKQEAKVSPPVPPPSAGEKVRCSDTVIYVASSVVAILETKEQYSCLHPYRLCFPPLSRLLLESELNHV